MENITTTEDMEICIVCMQSSNVTFSLFEQDENSLSIAEKIEKCVGNIFDYQLLKSPKICGLCLDDLSAAYRFLCNCESSADWLRSEQEKGNLDTEDDSNSYVQYNLLGQEINLPVGIKLKEIPQTDIIQVEESVLKENEISSLELEQIEKAEKDVYSEFDDSEQLGFEEEHLEEELNEEIIAKNDNVPDNEMDLSKVEPEIENEEDIVDDIEKPVRSKHSKIIGSKPIKKFKEKIARSPKVCKICGNVYKYQHALNAHMRRHYNERPYSCEFCEKSFVSNVEMKRHMRVHTGYKPYACQYCDRRFSDYGSRIKHERTHTGERPFSCSICNKSFAYAHVLSVHIRTHTGEKKFKCTQCGKGFTKKTYMLAHMEHHARAALLSAPNDDENSNAYQQQQQHNVKHENLETPLGENITTYIVEEIDGEVGEEIQILQDISDEPQQQQRKLGQNEKILGL